MSTYLWKYYFQDDIDKFQQFLAAADASAHTKGHGFGTNLGPIIGSPGKGLASSPTLRSKGKTQAEWSASSKVTKGSATKVLTRADVNARDAHGVTLLHHVASSPTESASSFALALLTLPVLDLYVQDLESGWTSLHRALYFGNVTIARALMQRDTRDAAEHGSMGASHNGGGLIKIKDREGNSPFDVFGASITNRIIRHGAELPTLGAGTDEEESDTVLEDEGDSESGSRVIVPRTCIDGDELFMFGSNKNLTLGFGDEDDRQFPERIALQRPEHLLRRLFAEHQSRSRSSMLSCVSLAGNESDHWGSDNIPAVVISRPIKILDVQLSKLHTAILTTDPEANLFMCGFGPGGRLGTGDQSTRFKFTCVYGGGLLNKKVVNIGLGQNHSIAISSHGEVFTWGSSGFGQLGYSLPSSGSRDDDTVQSLPRQIFGALKRETLLGAAASRVHSVVHTSSSLYTFGKNDGQLGLVDSDARSLEIQITPRRVAASLFSSSISMVSAIDKATICLLENRDTWVFANYGWKKVTFPLDGFSNYFLKNSQTSTRYDSIANHITKISSGGDTICAMANSGDVFTMTVSQSVDASLITSSTTNPAKIRSSLSTPQRIWSLRKSHMAVRDVDVGQDGSVIICTESGSVWKRVKRAKIKDSGGPSGVVDYKPKDYKFSRIPGLTRITAVRSNTFGAFAAVRRDTDVLKVQVEVASNTIWKDIYPLLSFHGLSRLEDSDTEDPAPRFWTPRPISNDPATIGHAVLTAKSPEEDIATLIKDLESPQTSRYDVKVGILVSDVRIPCHEFMLAGRSSILRHALQSFRQAYYFSIPDVLTVEYDKQGEAVILFHGIDFLTLLNFVLYSYTDALIDVWHHTRHKPQMASRYRLVRTELMKTAGYLEMRGLEHAARLMVAPAYTLHHDLELAICHPEYFETGDVEVELRDTTCRVHSALICQRCPFFEGLFHGRAAGSWLSSRRKALAEPQEAIKVDLKHVEVKIFRLVLRHIYADSGEELFDEIVTADLESFLDLIMDVLSVANELMLDRLAQVCQKMLGRFVNTRNACQLLNAVAPCSVTGFKDAALEYICLNLEGMLENQLLNELDDDLMLELDEIVKQNQLACMPYAKSGRREAELYERHPELAGLIERGRLVKIDSMALKSRLHEDEARYVTAGKAKVGTSGEHLPNIQPRKVSASKDRSTETICPSLKSQASATDLMFDMDDEVKETTASEKVTSSVANTHSDDYGNQPPRAPSTSMPREELWFDARGKALSPPANDLPSSSLASPGAQRLPTLGIEFSSSADAGKSEAVGAENIPWKGVTFTSSKLDMKDIMAQTSSRTQSQISSALSARAKHTDMVRASTGGKLSQKERKKQLQQQQLQSSQPPHSPELLPELLPVSSSTTKEKPSPWRTASAGAKVSLKDVLQVDREKSPDLSSGKTRTSPNPSLTLRQTVSGSTITVNRASDKRPAIDNITPRRSISSPIVTDTNPTPQSPSTLVTASPIASSGQRNASASPSPATAIRSIRHSPLPVEPSLQLSMADILSQQQTEKDIIKEAVAKRSLQEIQEEQAFQEWWDQEEAATKARLLEEEAATKTSSGAGPRGGRSARGGRGKGRGGVARGRGRGGRGNLEGSAGSTSGNPAVGK
ncbi:hypothetical protein MMC13_006475 [Lambiella insularis]|nr:hypothetical protein [Lambiella insularis]